MSLMTRILGGLSRRSAPRSADQVLEELHRRSGLADLLPGVSVHSAMQVVTVMACVRAIANGCATPALNVFRAAPNGGGKVARDLRVQRLLSRRPNEWQTSFEWRRMMTLHAALTGDGLSYKVKVGNDLRELIPVRPGSFQVEQTARYELRYRIWDGFGLVGVFGPEDVFHLPNWQWDQVSGLDAVRLARNAIGLATASEAAQAALHQNGGRPSGLLSTDQTLTKEAQTRLRESWREFLATSRGGTAVLDSGFRYTPLMMTGVDAQHLETRRHQVEEICRAFDVFPIMIGHSDKTSTFASSEAFFAAHLKHTLGPWLEMWSQRLDEFVLDGAGPLYCGFDTRYLAAGSMRDRAQWARTMTEMGIYTRNEIRDEEGKGPLPGLDEPLTPLNMAKGQDDSPPADDQETDDDQDAA